MTPPAATRPAATRPAATRLTGRGHAGAGLGRHGFLEPPPEWRGTTRQVAGLWPWAVGGTAPTVGVPLGHRLGAGGAGRTVCGDPISWFTQARLMSNPSWFVLGIPGLGKSSLTRRIVIGLAPTAVPLILGDLKPDYVDVVAALGGQILPLGRGRGSLNVLDPGQMDEAAARLGGQAGSVLREEGHGRRLGTVRALLAVVRGRPTADYEDSLLSAALRLLTRRWARRRKPPLLADLIALIQEAPDELRHVALDRGSDARYYDTVDPLLRTLLALDDGALGAMFARPTSQPLRLDAPAVCVDVSGISASDRQLQAAALLAAGATGSARSKPPTRSPTPATPRNAPSWWCSTSCGGCCAPAKASSTGSTN